MKLNWKKLTLSTLILVGTCLLATGCGTVAFPIPATTPVPTPNVVPTISTISPLFAVQTSSPTVGISGTGFIVSSVVNFNGSTYIPQFVNSQKLQIAVKSSDIAVPGNVQVSVSNPPPGGGNSASATFQVWQSLTDRTTGMSVALPLLGGASPSLMVDASSNAGGTITPVFTPPGSTTGVSGFGISIDTNDQHLGLLQWFEQNIDANGTLISSGAYVQQTLPDGSSEILPGSASTEAFYAAGGLGPLSAIYRLINNGYVVSAFPSTEPALYDAGLLSPTDSQTQLELNVLSTVHF
jgi:hypothetical protein